MRMKYYSLCIYYIYCLLKFNNIVITLKINNIHKSFYHNYNNNYYKNNINKVNSVNNNNIKIHSNILKRKNVILNLSYELRPHNTLDSNYINNNNNNNGMRSLILDDFNQILEAISIFIEINGDSNIPNKFEIPAEVPWPSSLHGLRLGLFIFIYIYPFIYLYLSIHLSTSISIFYNIYASILFISIYPTFICIYPSIYHHH